MKTRVPKHLHLVASYRKYKRKLERARDKNSSRDRVQFLIKRLQNLKEKLLALQGRSRLAAASALLVAGLTFVPDSATAQNFKFQSDVPFGSANTRFHASSTFGDLNGDGHVDVIVGGQLSTADIYWNDGDGGFTKGANLVPADLFGFETPGAGDTLRVRPALVDVDNDNDLDVFLGIRDGSLRYFTNDGTGVFTLDADGNPLAAVDMTDDASPTFADVDGDGDLDAIIGKAADGKPDYWINNGDGTFTDSTDASNPFEGVSPGEDNSFAAGDINGDGDIEVLTGAKDGVLKFYDQDAMGNYVEMTGVDNPFDGLVVPDFGDAQVWPTFHDYNDDGFADLIVGTNDGAMHHFANNAGTFSMTETPFNTLGIPDVVDLASHDFVDWDGDGDQDIFTGNTDGNIKFFENDGGAFTENTIDNPFDGVDVGDLAQPHLIDWDEDGDLDAFVGRDSLDAVTLVSQEPSTLYYENDGGTMTLAESPISEIEMTGGENVQFIDWDGDGDLDVFIGNKDGDILYYENDGTGAFTQNDDDNPLDGENVSESVHFDLADVDGDGDIDAYIGKEGVVEFYENVGGVMTQNEDANPFADIDMGRAVTPTFGDIDGDDDLDLLVGTGEGLTFHFENVSVPPVAGTIANQTATIENAYSFMIPADAFTVGEGTGLSIDVRNSDGSDIPAWLEYDGTTSTLTGTPSEANLGTVSLRAIATDDYGSKSYIDFDLAVEEAALGLIDDASIMMVYPNPTPDAVTIRTQGLKANLVELLDFSGRRIISKKMEGSSVALNLIGVNPGVYFVRVTGANKVAVQKLVIN